MTDKIDLEQLEAVIKLSIKYQVEEITLPDGTRIVKKLHPIKPMQPRKKESKLPINQGWSEELLYAASGPPKLRLNPNAYLMVNPPSDEKVE